MSCMIFAPKASSNLLLAAGALVVLISTPITICAAPPEPQPMYAEPLKAKYRGCESGGWCRFWIESLDPRAQSLFRVYPDGVPRAFGNAAVSIAVRDRLNVLLVNMVHQYKRIVLHNLREVEDGMFAATIIVNEAKLASDPILLELHSKIRGQTTQ